MVAVVRRRRQMALAAAAVVAIRRSQTSLRPLGMSLLSASEPLGPLGPPVEIHGSRTLGPHLRRQAKELWRKEALLALAFQVVAADRLHLVLGRQSIPEALEARQRIRQRPAVEVAAVRLENPEPEQTETPDQGLRQEPADKAITLRVEPVAQQALLEALVLRSAAALVLAEAEVEVPAIVLVQQGTAALVEPTAVAEVVAAGPDSVLTVRAPQEPRASSSLHTRRTAPASRRSF